MKSINLTISLILGAFVAIAAVVFALQNPESMPIKLWLWEFESSKALILIIAIAIGILMTLFFSIPGIFSRIAKVRTLNKEIKNLQIQIGEKDAKIVELNDQMHEVKMQGNMGSSKPAEPTEPDFDSSI